MTHSNAYGQQVADCTDDRASYVPGQVEADCGVDPFTDSGTSFDRGSGDNTYTITVKNSAPPTSATGTPVGDTLSCETGAWEDNPTFSYHWLRNGNLIPSAEAAEYTVSTEDEGKLIQCEVTGSNAGSANSDTTTAITVAPVTAAPPLLTSEVTVSSETGTVTMGQVLSCDAGEWTGTPTFAFQWLRNGAPIAGATSSTYEVAADDSGTSLQCEALATNAAGTAVADNRYFVMVAPEPTPFPPYVEVGKPGPAIPVPPPPNEAHGRVTVADALPSGLLLAGPSGPESRVFGDGWSCSAPTNNAFECSRSDGLSPEAEYPPIHAAVHVEAGASPNVVNTATVAGGGAASNTTSDPAVIASVPFGIARFTTSVADSVGDPFTQAAGHPFAANSTFVLNFVPGDGVTNAGESSVVSAGGDTLKDGGAELPPGFLGDPQNAERCETPTTLLSCPPGSIVGYAEIATGPLISAGRVATFRGATASPVWNLAPQPGRPAELGFVFAGGVPLVLEASLRSDGNYGITIGDRYAGKNGPAPLGLSLTLCENGVTGASPNFSCSITPQPGITGPFLTNPTRCSGPAPTTTLHADSWQDPEDYASTSVYNGASLIDGEPSATESFVTGCGLLQFGPKVEYEPSSEDGTTQAGQPTGTTFSLKVSQTNEAEKLATPELKNATITLPEGMTADPSAADGLEVCSNTQFGLGSTTEPAETATCPLASQVGTVKVVTPLLEKPVEGQAFIGEPECSPCSNADAEAGHLFRLFLQVRLPERGVIVKLAGHVAANPITGRLQATFIEQPQLPFSELVLTLKGGPRAALANPQSCGPATTTTDLTPWSAPGLGGLTGTDQIEGTPDATPSSSFSVDWDGKGGTCPATLPFAPTFLAQTASSAAGQYSPLSVAFGRPQPSAESEERDEQNLAGIALSLPNGLLGKIAGIEQCAETAANAGTCSPSSEIGAATVAAGAGSHPYYLTGHVYLTGPYRSDPYGVAVTVPAEAGPFKLAGNTGTGLEVVRAGIAVNPNTAALTVTSDPLPQILDGVPLRLHNVRVDISRSNFTLNPTSCASRQQIAGSIAGQPISQGESAKTASVASPFATTGCASLSFHPTLTAMTSGITSKANGASLNIAIDAAPGEANIGKVNLTLPKALPSRLSTLHDACTDVQFDSNPANCPVGSNIGTATARTPLLNTALSGPVYLVSHGNVEFPDVEMVLQGENGLEILLDGQTQIRGGVTYSRFESLPDAPITSFDTTLPEGPHSIFSASKDLCAAKRLDLGATLTGQNGAQTIHSVPIKVTGCKPPIAKPLTRAQRLAKALKACKRAKGKKRRAKCDAKARRQFGPKPKASKRGKGRK